jgi:hypothetical protein
MLVDCQSKVGCWCLHWDPRQARLEECLECPHNAAVRKECRWECGGVCIKGGACRYLHHQVDCTEFKAATMYQFKGFKD